MVELNAVSCHVNSRRRSFLQMGIQPTVAALTGLVRFCGAVPQKTNLGFTPIKKYSHYVYTLFVQNVTKLSL